MTRALPRMPVGPGRSQPKVIGMASCAIAGGCLGLAALLLGQLALAAVGLIVGALCGLDSYQRSGEHLEWSEREFAVVSRTTGRQAVDLWRIQQIHLERDWRGSRRISVWDALGQSVEFDVDAYPSGDGWKLLLATSVSPTTEVNKEAFDWLSRGWDH